VTLEIWNPILARKGMGLLISQRFKNRMQGNFQIFMKNRGNGCEKRNPTGRIGVSPVRISWRRNLFGQAGRLSYHEFLGGEESYGKNEG
jgi:hypothetical protein